MKAFWLVATWAALAGMAVSACIGLAALAAKVADTHIHFAPQAVGVLWITLFLLGAALMLSGLRNRDA